MPAVFFCWLKDPRQANNRPENLMTRIEGYLLTIGVSSPLLTTYQTSYRQTALDQEKSRGAPTPVYRTDPISVHGRLRGYSLVLSFTALLGI